MSSKDASNHESPDGPETSRPDLLDRGIQVAFGLDPELDTPVAGSALDAFRRAGRLPRISLRETEEPRSPLALPAPPASGPPLAGTGRYQVNGEIARGGVGSVLKARDHDLGRDVALKVLLEVHRGHGEMTRRFLEEAQIAAQLQHPGIVPVHEIGLLADDRPYFAMELVKGHTLAELFESRSSPDEGRQRFLGIFGQICQTLAYAHSRGVVHRDLKPANVMVGAFGEVQVMDWGVAKVLHRSRAGADPGTTTIPSPGGARPAAFPPAVDTGVSHAGSVIGTPAYMPPEQARGAGLEVDERADVFGLGGILCELLTGKPPYAGKSLAEVIEKALHGDLAEARRRLEQSGADRELIDLALSCLTPEPEERPRNAVVVSKRVAAHLEAAGRRARELEVRAARARLRLGLALSILAAVILGGGAFVWIERERRAQERNATLAVGRAISQARELRARAAAGEDPSLWDASLREARRGLELATGAAAAVVAEARGLHAELSAQVDDERLAADLDRLREERDVDSGEQEDRFREVFADHGLDVENAPADLLASQIRGRSIATRLVLALDQWAIPGPLGPFGRRGVDRRRLLEIAQLADDDPWRTRLRRALASEDRELLGQLVKEAATAELAAPTLEMLAFAVGGDRWLAPSPELMAVWRRAQELHPHDFWINVSLGDALGKSGENAAALQYLRAAVALRPGSAHGRYKLGSALLDEGLPAEAFTEFERSLTLDPGKSWPYFRCVQALEKGRDSIARPRLEGLRAALEGLPAAGKDYPDEARTSLLAEVWLALGEPRRGLLDLERLERSRGRGPALGPGPRDRVRSSAEVLARHRELARPDLLSFASIEAALAAGGAQPFASEPVVLFLRLHEGADAPAARARLLYVEGRKLQHQGEYQAAAGVFARVIDLDAGLPEPFLRRAESLRQAGNAAPAEAFLREALEREDLQYPEAWKLWVRLAFADLGLSAREALDRFPEAPRDGAAEERWQPPGYAAELRRVLETIAAAQPVRFELLAMGFAPGLIHRPQDRGTPRAQRRLEPQLVKLTPRAGAALCFMTGGRLPTGYEVPLPPGSYRVELRARDGDERAALAALGPTVEGQAVTAAAGVSPGSARREDRVSTLRIEDGFLDLQWAQDRGRPAAFEVVILKLD